MLIIPTISYLSFSFWFKNLKKWDSLLQKVALKQYKKFKFWNNSIFPQDQEFNFMRIFMAFSAIFFYSSSILGQVLASEGKRKVHCVIERPLFAWNRIKARSIRGGSDLRMNHERVMIYLRTKWPSLPEVNASYNVTRIPF